MAGKYKDNKHLISGLLREMTELYLPSEVITNDNLKELFKNSKIPKNVGEKLDKLLLHIFRRTEFLYQEIIINILETQSAIGYAKNMRELENMLSALSEKGFLKKIEGRGVGNKVCVLTIEGIDRCEILQKDNIQSIKVFVAMGFKPDLLEAHKIAIQPACKECGLAATLVSEAEHNIGITDKIIAEIKTSKFVITDFTYNNQGAYFEAGYAQGRGLEVIRTCKKEWFDGNDANGNRNRLHFDISHYNFILWESYEDLRIKLINRIRAAIL